MVLALSVTGSKRSGLSQGTRDEASNSPPRVLRSSTPRIVKPQRARKNRLGMPIPEPSEFAAQPLFDFLESRVWLPAIFDEELEDIGDVSPPVEHDLELGMSALGCGINDPNATEVSPEFQVVERHSIFLQQAFGEIAHALLEWCQHVVIAG